MANVQRRVASFAKFRKMQKTIQRKIFRENCVQETVKMVTANFDPFMFQIGAKRPIPTYCTNLIDVIIVIS